MLTGVFINEKFYHFKEEISILEACNSIGIKLPRFCYHENLSIAGNCRMCLVELEKAIKPIVACSTELISNMSIFTNTPLVLKSRENVLEFLLLNHPLDCPICDQGGECDLQDQAIFFGSNFSRNYFSKRSVEDKNCGPLIKTIMNRCIHCTRCVRFGEEVCGIKFFGTLNRGLKTEINNYLLQLSLSEMSANVIDLCPVGALTLKPTPFQARSWELKAIESIDLSDCVGSNIYLLYKHQRLMKITPKKNVEINNSWISNKSRFYYDTIRYFDIIYSDFYKIQKFNNSLFLLNSTYDLKILYLLKKISNNCLNTKVRLLNSNPTNHNFYFWGNKSKISQIMSNSNYLCFLITTNLQIEATILNIKLRYKTIVNKFKLNYFGVFFKSNLPLNMLKFSIYKIISLFLAKNKLFSKKILETNTLFFSNKMILDRLDMYLFSFLKFKLPNSFFFNVSAFCNTEGANYLNFKKFNFKEVLKSEQIFGLNLTDSLLLRKLILKNSNFTWVSQFPSVDLFRFFDRPIWFSLEVGELPGYYLNLEQRVQKTSLLTYNLKFSLFRFLYYFWNTMNNFALRIVIYKTKKKFSFLKTFVRFNFFIELCNKPQLFNSIRILNFSMFFFNHFFYFKTYPVKSVLEDVYRSSQRFRCSEPLIKNSSLLRASYTI